MKYRLLLLLLTIAVNTGILQAQWLQSAGPDYQLVFALTHSGSKLLAAVPNMGLYRSPADNPDWRNDAYYGMSCFLHTVDAWDRPIIMAGSSTIIVSTDGGDTWDVWDNGMPIRCGVNALLEIDRADGGTYIYAGTTQGDIRRSSDHGLSWAPVALDVHLQGTAIYTLTSCLDDTGNRVLLAGTSGKGIFRSTDSGFTWQQITSGLPNEASVLSFASINDGATSFLLAGLYENEIYRSTDFGLSWERSLAGFPDSVTARCFLARSDANSSRQIFCGTYYNGLYISSDDGRTWEPRNSDFPEGLSFMAFHEYPAGGGKSHLYAASSFGGIFKSTDDGNSWVPFSAGLPQNYYIQFVKSMTEPGMRNLAFAGEYHPLYGTSRGILRSTDYGKSWELPAVNTPDWVCPHDVHYLPDNNDGYALMAGLSQIGLGKSTDDGVTWQPVPSIFDTASVYTFLTVPGSSHTYTYAATFPNGIYRSSDRCKSWERAADGFPTRTWTPVLRYSEGRIIAGTEYGVYYSDDGTSWTGVPTGGKVTDIEMLPGSQPPLLLSAVSPLVNSSTDNGTSWKEIRSNAIAECVEYSVDGFGRAVLFSGNFRKGVLVSYDTGKTWIDYNDGIPPETNISALEINEKYLIAGTEERGIFYRPISDFIVGVERLQEHLPSGISLHDSYPNPFRASSMIGVSLPSRQAISLTVYNMLGKEVAVLASGVYDAGELQIPFHAEDLQPGIYMCVLRAGNRTFSKKMMLMK